MKLRMIGEIFGTSGYAQHTRNHVNALYKNGIKNISLDVPRPQGWERNVNDNELKMLLNKPTADMINLMVAVPPYYSFGLSNPHKKFIGFVVWEGNRVPKYWIKNLRKCDQIWVPSKHVRHAINETRALCNIHPKLMNKIKTVPHGVDISIFKPIKVERSDKFTFFANKGWAYGMRDRGGMQYLFKAFAEEFRKDEPVRLLAKINPAYNQPGWNIQNEMAKLNLAKDHAEIQVTADNVTLPILNELYNQGDCFVSTQMADGFNLPGLEAMATGMPTIQTGFGGQTDYMTEKNSWKINYALMPVDWDIMYESVNWAVPDRKHLRELLRYAFENQDEVKKKGEQALKDAQKWTWDNTAKKGIKALEELNAERKQI